MHEAQLTQKSISNQAAFCCVTNLKLRKKSTQFQIAWIPIEMTKPNIYQTMVNVTTALLWKA